MGAWKTQVSLSMAERVSSKMIRSLGFGRFITFLLVGMVISSCSDVSRKPDADSGKTTDKMSFLAYRDTLIKTQSLNQQLNTNYSPSELGQPIGVMETPYWLITVGPWRMNNRNILVQGTAFRIGNPFYPNPIRKVEVEFEGPFSGVIRYDEQTDTYGWLIKPDVGFSTFDYQRTLSKHLLITERMENGLRLVDVGTGKELVLSNEKGKVIDWSMNETKESVVFLTERDSVGNLSIEEFDLNELLAHE